MNIVLSTNQFLPYSTGGVEVLALGLAQAYQAAGHETFILCAEPDDALGPTEVRVTQELVAGVPVDRLWINPARNEEDSWACHDPSLAPILQSVLATRRPTVFHALTFGLLSSVTLEVAGQMGCRLFYTACGYELTCSLIELIRPDNTLCDGNASLRRCLACRRPHTPQSELVYAGLRWWPEQLLVKGATRWRAHGGRSITLFEILSGLVRRAERMQSAIEKLDGIIAPSAWSKDVLLRNGAPDAKVKVVHHGVQDEVRAIGKKPSRGGLRFGYIGRITPIKGVDQLLRAFLRVSAKHASSLVIYGPVAHHDHDYMEECQETAAGHPEIRFGGLLDRSQIADAFSEIDVLVVPSVWHEVLGIVIQEAFATRTPVIAADIGGIPDLVHHGVNGWLYPPFSEDSLRRVMEECCANPAIVHEKQKMVVSPRTVKAEAQELLGLYRSMP